jgi:DNA polymerase I-like protein with 3'-5' exonuclease and polymerase domains
MNHLISRHWCTNTWEEFMTWQAAQPDFMLDTETTMDSAHADRKLLYIQFGSEQDQWALQWSYISEQQRAEVGQILSDRRVKLLHNAYFDCVVLRFAGLVLREVYCTMVTEMILNCGKLNNNVDVEEEEDEPGEEHSFYSYGGLLDRYLQLNISKALQTSFTDDSLTEDQFEYMCTDVRHLKKIRRFQHLELHLKDLEFTCALDNAAIPGLAEMTYAGMPLDTVKWRENIELAAPVVAQAKADLDGHIRASPKLLAKITSMGKYCEEDRVLFNPNSHNQLRAAMERVYPDCPGATQQVVKGYLKHADLSEEDTRILEEFRKGNKLPFAEKLYHQHKDFLIEHDLLVPAGEITVNWNSPDQVLEVLKVLDPKLKDTSKQSMAKFPFPIGISLKEYKDSLKLLTTYGEQFIVKHMQSDGKVRTTFNLVVSTGRLSSRGPNMQNIPAKESVGTRYRNAFVAEEGWVYVDSDYASQELVVIAFISGDPVWTKALKEGKDLHSVCAELVFKDKWKRAAEPDCAYYKTQQKCKCKGHKRLRDSVKTINFGLAYGMSKFKLSATLGITIKEAEELILEYFKAFPGIGSALGYLGRFGVMKGYIQTLAPFYRKRWFPYWRFARMYVDEHVKGIRYDSTLGSVERASKNMPIQGTSADMTKTAIFLMFEYIHDNNLSHKVKLVMQVHDQLTSRARKDYAEQWKEKKHEIMLEAAKFSITNGLLGADTNISEVWTK